MTIINNEMNEFLEDFLIESRELIETVDEELVMLEKKPEDKDLLNSIFRAIHTIKGTSSFIGLEKISKFSHHVENVLNRLRNTEWKIDSSIMDIILESVDIIKKMMLDLENGKESNLDITKTTKKLSSILSDSYDKSKSDKPIKKKTGNKKGNRIGIKNAKPKKQKTKIISKNSGEKKKIGEIFVDNGLITNEDVAIALDKQDEVPKLGEVLLDGGKITKKDINKALKVQGKEKISIEETIRVGISRLDNLMNIVSELVLGRNRLVQLRRYFEDKYENDLMAKNLSELSDSFDLLTADLHTSLMKIRMVPINKVFSKYPRLVRDLCRGAGKKVELEIIGADTELDKSVCEKINDPLVHLLRNSIDHGIEEPSARRKTNKPKIGNIKLKAFHEGNDVIIEIEDDGKGIDIPAVKDKAVKNGIITKQEAEKLYDRDVYNLIFQPGFSTAKKVTSISGRGVGMDVVKTNIEKLKGIIEIESEKGVKTLIKLKIPLTLEIMQALIINTNGESFAIPINSIIEIISLEETAIKTIKGQEVVNLRDSILSIIRLDKLFQSSANGTEAKGNNKPYIVIAGVAERKLGIVVSNLVGKEDVVIKPIENYLYNLKNIAGATILGDGRVCLVLDVSGLIRQIL